MPEKFEIKSGLRNYEVCWVKDCVAAIGDQRSSRSFLVIDEDLPTSGKISKLFSKDRVIRLKADEKTKTFDSCSELIRQLVDRNVRRNEIIFAVGGGVIEDVVAFVSTVLFRGVEWVFIPTTLLAQADSCIGSKSSINFGVYKNLLGAFYPPSKVLIAPNFLNTLPADELRSGMGEILHFYLVAGEVKMASQLKKQHRELLKDPSGFKPYILASLKIKKSVIQRDEFDKGERNLFNYGHTFGHAIESVTNYRINHGQAVTMGMDIANFISWRRGHIKEEVFNYLHGLIAFNLPEFRLDPKNWAKYLQALSKDKKNVGKSLGCILTRRPGKMFKAQLPLDQRLGKDILSYFD